MMNPHDVTPSHHNPSDMPLVYASGMALGLCLYACVVRDAGHASMAAVVVAAATETTAAAVLSMNAAEDITTEW